MTRLSIVSVAVAFGLLTIGGGNVAIAQTKTTTNRTQCFTDDGNGRLRSCSQGFKKSNPNWHATDNCYTDDGYGRLRSCSQAFKKSSAKRKKSKR